MARPRKPTFLKLVAGTERECRKMPDEPTPPHLEAPPAPPDHLSKDAAVCWERMAKVLQGMGVLTEADLFAFERLCMTYAEMRSLDYQLEALGSTTYQTVSERSGVVRRGHPEFAQKADSERRFLQYLGQFGLTPAARTKISIDKRDGKDPLGKYFA